MEQTKHRGKAKRTKRNRTLAGLLMALLVVGAAAGVGLAMGKKETVPMAPTATLDSGAFMAYRIDFQTGPSNHTGWIEVQGWTWGVTQSGTAGSGGGGGTGKAEFHDFSFTKRLDPSTPILLKACVTGQHLPMVTFEGASSSEKGPVYMRITMEDAIISSYQTGGSNGDQAAPMESISINYAKIEFSYIGADPNLSGSFGYDLAAGRET